jgi:2-keto-3-deoxy-L-rhamnonate aldolase RhmA
VTDLWTVEDAAALLDPPMTVEQVRALIRAAAIPPAGQRRTGRRGRPAEVYDAATLLRAHAALAPFLAEAETHGEPNGDTAHFVI